MVPRRFFTIRYVGGILAILLQEGLILITMVAKYVPRIHIFSIIDQGNGKMQKECHLCEGWRDRRLA
jgi:hypothetical protein